MNLRLSSRQSDLAKIQAYQVGEKLKSAGNDVDYLFRESLGDKNLTDPLWKMPEKGVFTEDFFQDLVTQKTDLVVHSWKDLPTALKAETEIVATLPRADQRDLLILKKNSRGKSKLQIYSSSPRRAHNLSSFLSWALPWKFDSLEFQSVRGNIQTRVRKLLEQPEVDGLVLAKAAMDRLLTSAQFSETQVFLREALKSLDWMVLPLSENPNAAAQGAIAIESLSAKTDLYSQLKKINCDSTFKAVTRERQILNEYGGGCHLALGMSVLERDYGRIEIVKGMTPDQQNILSKKFFPAKAVPKNLKRGQLKFQVTRTARETDVTGVDALFVSKFEAYIAPAAPLITWAAGLQTWKKLAEKGVWVHGSAEGLGESEDPQVAILAGQKLRWGRLSHDSALDTDDKKRFSTYHVELQIEDSYLDDSDVFTWKSGLEFKTALSKFPELKNRKHICGPGRTFDVIKKELGTVDNLFVELNDEFVTII